MHIKNIIVAYTFVICRTINNLLLSRGLIQPSFSTKSFTQSLKRRISLKNIFYSCGVTYEIVSNIPKVKFVQPTPGS